MVKVERDVQIAMCDVLVWFWTTIIPFTEFKANGTSVLVQLLARLANLNGVAAVLHEVLAPCLYRRVIGTGRVIAAFDDLRRFLA